LHLTSCNFAGPDGEGLEIISVRLGAMYDMDDV